MSEHPTCPWTHVLEFFSCSGGMAEGFRRAGFPVTTAFDWDPDACDSYEQNHGHRPIRIDARDVLRLLDTWKPTAVDLIVCDPPCTPWSRAGKRLGTEDARDMLGPTIELILAIRPRAYLIGNVPGLDDSTNWGIVQGALGELAEAGYCVRDFKSLDAADYGVPQHRVRPFWFGHLDGPCLRWPERTHGSPDECRNHALPGTRALRPWVTVREALGHLPPEQMGSPVRLRWRECNSAQHGSVPDRPARVVGTSNLSDGNVLLPDAEPRRSRPSALPRASDLDAPAGVVTTGENGDGNIIVEARAGRRKKTNHRPSSWDEPAKTLTRNTHSDGALLTNQKHPSNRADEPSFTVTTKGDGRGAQGACVVAWPWDAPSTTIAVDDRIPPPGHHPESGSILSQPNAVKLSERAAAILQGFPEDWLFSGKTKKARWAQLGQAMPPALAEGVARAVREHFESVDRKARSA
jgi:DNA (cytosine-5)-methyltransferase 1